jgi:hypothetical protein
VGPQDEGLKAFTAIAEHGLLSQTVIELNFDVRLFEQGINQRQYFQLLLRQIRHELRFYPKQQMISGADHDTCRMIKHATEPLPLHAKELVEEEKRLGLLPAVRKGHDDYTRRAR